MIIFKALDKINEINFNEEYMHVPDLELNTFIFGKKKKLDMNSSFGCYKYLCYT